MKQLLLLLLLSILICSTSAEDYTNPMNLENQYGPISANADDYGIGDPFVMRYNGMYYLYPSTCEDRVKVWTSRDLIHWNYEGYCTKGRDVYFAYAPEVCYWRGSFYMITSPRGAGHYILKSDSPLGPFELITANFGHSIDGSFWKLDDGKLMILFPDNWVIKSAVLDEKTMLPSRTSSTTGATLKHWTEGPGLIRRGDWYYLTFTGNHVCSTGYKVAFASRKDSPKGNFIQREDSTLLVNSVYGDAFKGLGHSSNVIGPDLDSLYTAYHSLVSLEGPARMYNLDRLLTNGGLLYTTGPSCSPMPVPAMPDVWGDARGELNGFSETHDGYCAETAASDLFTQEWNFVLNGGVAKVCIAEKGGKAVMVLVDSKSIGLYEGDKRVRQEKLPEIGPDGCMHTLRVEHAPELMHLYVDGMRVLTKANPGYTASQICAYKSEGVEYSFMACTAQAMGSSDNSAVKLIPGDFSAIHALNAEDLKWEYAGSQEEKAAILGSADYRVRVAADGTYCFDLTVRKKDAGKQLTILLDGQTVTEAEIPKFGGRGNFFTFTTKPAVLNGGDHVLTIAADDVLLNRVDAFEYEAVQPLTIDFTDNSLRNRFITLGNCVMKPSEGVLQIPANRMAFALFGNEGNTDYSIDVRFEIPDAGNGSCGILIRATDVSLYDAQVKESYYGYSITVSRLGVSLKRARYGAVGNSSFEKVAQWESAKEGNLHIELKGNRLEVYLPGENKPILSAEDDKPFTHGKYGFFSTGKELTVLDMTVSPVE